MRQVNRKSVGTPSCLLGDLSSRIETIRSGKGPDSGVYAHSEVKACLKTLYKRKCYLCEREIDDGGEVEHFLPWHKDEPERAYDWCNLHWSCKACNGRKRKSVYKDQPVANGAVQRTLLIDPTNVVGGGRIEDLFKFDEKGEAIAVNTGPDPVVIVKTIDFLNEPIPLIQRKDRWREVTNFILESNCHSEWREMRDEDPIRIDAFDETRRARRSYALERASRLYRTFLSEEAEFSIAIRDMLWRNLDFSWRDFEYMNAAWEQTRKI